MYAWNFDWTMNVTINHGKSGSVTAWSRVRPNYNWDALSWANPVFLPFRCRCGNALPAVWHPVSLRDLKTCWNKSTISWNATVSWRLLKQAETWLAKTFHDWSVSSSLNCFNLVFPTIKYCIMILYCVYMTSSDQKTGCEGLYIRLLVSYNWLGHVQIYIWTVPY